MSDPVRIAPAPSEGVASDPGPSLHPDHLADLRRSGLSDDTIAAAEIRSLSPVDLRRLLGEPLARRVTSAYVIPYPEAEGFFRAKLFPPVSDGDGHAQRYSQPAGSAPRLYVPPHARRALADPTIPLRWTEGEKKALRADQEGLACIGLGGLWNWRADGRPIPDLDRVDWISRAAVILPDSDVWTRPDLLQAVYALGKELEGRGAAVSVLKLPAGTNGAKVGLDDFLCAHSVAELEALPKLPLTHRAFSHAADWWRGWNKRRAADSREPTGGGLMPAAIGAKAVPLLGRGRIHPALHVDGEGVVVGRVTEDGVYQLVTSEPDVYTPDDAKGVLAFTPRPYADLAGRWTDADVDDFLAKPTAPTFSEQLALIMNALDASMEFPRPEHRALFAAWAVATYFFPLFLTFPRLNLSGEPESGKSKVLTLLRATAFNGLLMVDPTAPVLYRLVQAYKPTMLLDEVEGLNKDDAKPIFAIINSGYKAGGTVPRCEGEKTKHVEPFAVYSPLALAAIKPVNAVTEDRCIPIVLQRGTDRSRINAEIDLAADLFARIRAGGYRLLLTRWRDVGRAYHVVPLPTWLNGRPRELWRPPLAVAAVADAENGLNITPDLLALAREHVGDRAGISAEGEALLGVLGERLGGADQCIVHPCDLREPLRLRLGWRDPDSAEAVAALLRRLGFGKAKPPRDRDGMRYEVPRDRLTAARRLYLPDQEGSA